MNTSLHQLTLKRYKEGISSKVLIIKKTKHSILKYIACIQSLSRVYRLSVDIIFFLYKRTAAAATGQDKMIMMMQSPRLNTLQFFFVIYKPRPIFEM